MIVERFGHLLAEHPLRREIIATIASNDVVNSQGITFVSRMVTETGASPADVVRAFRIARDVTGAVGRWADVEALDGLVDPARAVRADERRSTGSSRRPRAGTWCRAPGSVSPRRCEQSRASFAEVSDAISQIGPDAWREEHEQVAARRLDRRGVPEAVAHRHAFQPELVHAPDIIAVAHATGRRAARGGARVLRARRAARHRLARGASSSSCRPPPGGSAGRSSRWRTICSRCAAGCASGCSRLAGGAPIDEAIERYFSERAQAYERVKRFLRGLKMEGVTDLSQLTVALRQIRSLAG